MVNAARKNLMSRRNHKERAQPLHRRKLGLLEKHKDYVHRARDYKSKKDRIKKLREKAAFRNKDEFYWGMIKGKTDNGVAIANRGNEALSVDVVKLLKTQDVGYIKVQIAQDEKKILKLRAQLEVSAPVAGPSSEWTAASELAEVEKLAEMGVVLRPDQTKRKGKGRAPAQGHVVFAEGKEEFDSYGAEEETVEVVEEEEAAPDLGWLAPPEPKKKRKGKAVAVVEEEEEEDDEEERLEEAREHRMELLGNLSALLGRVRLLRQAEARLETTKGLMGKGAARKVREEGFVDDENAPEDRNGERKKFVGKQWKWKLERRK
ncbi:U3 small nucleolar RNA-associated protein 11 [Vanrija pseudolonga]|uniref:U3 small nucleolar RNA-associated protein 11 n=1 Tax=Vanrija pseudolonga TaxID=143232 RepID=A0AAF0YAP0_9TREE|nr:U3 small nucleolar RNA-associated protein 11 [Vanrija pseudolonga]